MEPVRESSGVSGRVLQTLMPMYVLLKVGVDEGCKKGVAPRDATYTRAALLIRIN